MFQYASSILLGAFAVGLLVAGAVRVRRRFLPEFEGSPGVVATAVIVASAIAVVGELLGTVGIFRRIAMCVVLAILGLVGCVVGTEDSGERAPFRDQIGGRWAEGISLAVVALVSASWAVRVVASLQHGMETIDTLWYHMPDAARFVQTGYTTRLHYVDAQPVTVFYPATSPIFHAFGLQLFSTDFVSVFINLGWLALALIAAWSIGAPHGVGPATMVGAAIVASTPGFVATQPGGAYTDIVGVALFLSSVALLLHSRRPRAQELAGTIVAALAAGLALGTKFTLIAPVGALTLVVLIDVFVRPSRVGTRIRLALAWCGSLLVTGGFFYVRNALRVGNPLPQFSFGPLDLPSPPVQEPNYNVARYLFRATIWRHFYIPGLWSSLGPAWWAICAFVLAGAGIAVITRAGRFTRLLGGVVLASVIAYLFTPQFLGFANRPVYFAVNVRYVSPALALGLCLVPTLPAFRSVALWLFGAYVAVAVGTQYGPTVWSWSSGLTRPSDFFERIDTFDVSIGVVVGVVVLAVSLVFLMRPVWRRRVVAFVVSGVALLVIGYPVQQSYLKNRYTSTYPLGEIYAWAQHQNHQRIGVLGEILQYPFYGRHDSNYVQYIGKAGPHGAYGSYSSCDAWRRAINAAHFNYLVIVPPGSGPSGTAGPSRELAWTASDPHTDIVIQTGPVALLRISGRLDPNACRV
jgi:hypothetical protein